MPPSPEPSEGRWGAAGSSGWGSALRPEPSPPQPSQDQASAAVSLLGSRFCLAWKPSVPRQPPWPTNFIVAGQGSFRKRPTLETSVRSIVCAGDWVRMGDREHGAKGLCQERAYVCGLEAGNSLIRRKIVNGADHSHPVLPIRADEPQVVLGRALNKLVMDPIEALGLKLPWFNIAASARLFSIASPHGDPRRRNPAAPPD